MGQTTTNHSPQFVKSTTVVYTATNDGDSAEASIQSTDSFASILKVDSRGFRKLVLEIKNTDGANSIDYKILGSRKWRKGAGLSESFWDGSSEDFREIKASTALAASTYATDEEIDLKNYLFVVVQIKATTPGSQGDGLVRAVLS